MNSIALLMIRGAGWGYSILPWPMQRGASVLLGRALQWLKLRSKVVEQNLEIAFPSDPRMRKRIFREAYRHLASLVFEILMLPISSRKNSMSVFRRFVLRRSELDGAENWRAAHEAGKGVIFLSSHVGNWEVMAATGAIHGGMDLMIVTKRIKPDWLHDAIERGRASCGVKAAYEPRTLKDVLAHLRKGGTVGFVLDQYAGPPVGVRVPLFGIPVGTNTVVASLALKTGSPVLPVVNYRKPDGRFVVEIRPALVVSAPGAKDEQSVQLSVAQATARYTQEMEKDILAHSEQWLWIHKRFKGDLSPLQEGEWESGRARS